MAADAGSCFGAQSLELLLLFVICRLGAMWKSLLEAEKDRYVQLARKEKADHHAKYPGK
jgi:hypothetical protein